MLELALFVLASIGIVALSWRFLTRPRSHGFYRFFVLEAVAALVAMSLDRWFADPLSARQVVSWSLLAASAALAVAGFMLLERVGRPTPAARRADELGFEATTRLVTVGVYRYVRHPMYLSLLCLGWGAFVKDVSRLGLAVAAVLPIFVVATARAEEAENLRKFGDDYAAYAKRTKMLIPFVY